jgi:hypothetical protein
MTTKTNMQNATIYVPTAADTSDDRWDMVAAALRAAGVKDIRPAPMPAQSFKPRHARPAFIASQEV